MVENIIVIFIVIMAVALVLRRILKVFRRKDISCGCSGGEGCKMGAAPKKGAEAVNGPEFRNQNGSAV